MTELPPELKKKHPDVFTLSDAPLRVEAMPTGSYALDYALGIGGVPKGRITEVFGPDGSGKTTLVYSILSQAQRTDPGWVLFIDAEHRFDSAWAQKIGVDEGRLAIHQPPYAEKALEVMEHCLQGKWFSALAVDSVAALVPKAELEGDMGDAHIGLQARLMSQMLRKISNALRESNAVLLFTNQTRDKVGSLYGNPEVTPGGKALKFYASARIRLSNVTPMTQARSANRHTVKAVVHKNSVAPPYKTAEFDIIHGEGIDKSTDLLNFLKATGRLEVRGAYYFMGEENLGHKDDVVAGIEAEPEKWDARARKHFVQSGE